MAGVVATWRGTAASACRSPITLSARKIPLPPYMLLAEAVILSYAHD
ncbi:hypothetical protein [Nonomuraea longispora]|nr:hypothetical protein [Nonomuraea longispora]